MHLHEIMFENEMLLQSCGQLTEYNHAGPYPLDLKWSGSWCRHENDTARSLLEHSSPQLFFNFERNCTPRCSYEVSAAGLPWPEHFRVQCYTQVKVHRYLATKSEVEGFRDQGFVLPEVESLRVKSLQLLICILFIYVYDVELLKPFIRKLMIF